MDFNLQLYKENIAHLREPVQTMCAPYSLAKEEYSGTLHKGASLSHEIFLVLDGVAMTDVAEAEGLGGQSEQRGGGGLWVCDASSTSNHSEQPLIIASSLHVASLSRRRGEHATSMEGEDN